MEARNRSWPQGGLYCRAIGMSTPYFTLVWLHRHTRIHRQWFLHATEVSLHLYLVPVFVAFKDAISICYCFKVPVALHHYSQVIPCVPVRYILGNYHVDDLVLVESNLQRLSTPTRLLLYPFWYREMAIRRLYYLRLPSGMWRFVIKCASLTCRKLAYEAHKAKKIIASRDISYAFTNVMANNYYSLRMYQSHRSNGKYNNPFLGSYPHFCLFDHISNSTKKKDDFAFFIFFTFKSWSSIFCGHLKHWWTFFRLEAASFVWWSPPNDQCSHIVQHLFGQKG